MSPTSRFEALRTRLLDGASSGLFRAAVAEGAGILPAELDAWLEAGFSADAVEPYLSFAVEYRAREQRAQLPYLGAIQSAALDDPQVAFQWLAVRWPDQWGKNATKNTSAGVLVPKAAEEAAQRALVAGMFENIPPVLAQILRDHRDQVLAVLNSEPTDAEAPLPQPPNSSD